MDERRRIGGTDFVWNLEKAETTWRTRRIRFEDAATVFQDPFFVLVVHIEVKGDTIRIISARPAERHEEALYAQ